MLSALLQCPSFCTGIKVPSNLREPRTRETILKHAVQQSSRLHWPNYRDFRCESWRWHEIKVWAAFSLFLSRFRWVCVDLRGRTAGGALTGRFKMNNKSRGSPVGGAGGGEEVNSRGWVDGPADCGDRGGVRGHRIGILLELFQTLLLRQWKRRSAKHFVSIWEFRETRNMWRESEGGDLKPKPKQGCWDYIVYMSDHWTTGMHNNSKSVTVVLSVRLI